MTGHPLLAPDLLDDIAALYHQTSGDLTDLGSFENQVYAFQTPEGPRVLRLVHSSHRTERQVQAELHWLSFLGVQGVDVAAPVADHAGQLLSVWPDGSGGQYLATAFVRVPGERLNPVQATSGQLRAWGRLLADLHNQTQIYRPEDPQGRFHWHQDPYIEQRHARAAALPEALEPGIMERFDRLVERLAAQPTSPERYGLIHNDAHPGNVLVEGERLHLFDFDDCTHNFFVNDLAMALYYGLWGVPEEQREQVGLRLWTELLAGYRERRALPDPADLALVPTLLKLREVELYVLLLSKWEPDSRTEGQLRFLRDTRERILYDVPYLHLNFAPTA
ncbi:phosphotransferase enzyme family protein [Deinococcus sonorensis]|uniref:Phosphotransferase n=2 Tax=Deinococcus sonorensis TaxID=309891 RepID=A0AAU7UB68_9DEIO